MNERHFKPQRVVEPLQPSAEEQRAIERFRAMLDRLLASGIDMNHIATLLGIDEYVGSIGDDEEAAVWFDEDRLLHDLRESGSHLTLPTTIKPYDGVINPPDEWGGVVPGTTGEGATKPTEQIPRAALFVEVVTALQQPYEFIPGKVEPRMMRKTPYDGFYLPQLRVLALICNESHNASYVIRDIEQDDVTPLLDATKRQKKKVLNPQRLSVVRWSNPEQWKTEMAEALIGNKKEKIPLPEIQEYDEIPEQWEYGLQVSKRLKKGYSSVRLIADRYCATHPHWFRRQRGDHQRRIWMDPELCRIIEQQLNAREDAPERWHTMGWMRKTFNVETEWVEGQITPHLAEHPEWEKQYNVPGRGKYPHYAPELITLVREAAEKIPKPPEGWKTIPAIARTLGVSYMTVSKKVKELGPIQKEQWDFFRGTRRWFTRYYSPQFITTLATALRTEVEDAPTGWRTIGDMRRTLRAQGYSIPIGFEALVTEVARQNPGCKNPYRTPNNQIYDHYSPEVVTAIVSTLSVKSTRK